MQRSRRATAAGLALAVALVTAACGGDGADAADDAPASDDATTAAEDQEAASAGDDEADDAAGATSEADDDEAVGSQSATVLGRWVDAGWELSDDWVVETVAETTISGTGGLLVRDEEHFLVADFGTRNAPGNTVWEVSADGEQTALATSEDFDALTATVAAEDGTIYQSSYGSDRVFVVGLDGTVEQVAEGISGPTGLAPAGDGSVFVAAYDTGIVHRVAADGTVEDFATAPTLRGVNSLALLPDGDLWAANHRDGALHRISPDGTVELVERVIRATSHLVHLDGSLYLTSREGFVVLRYDLATGAKEVIAGTARPGSADGRGTEAAFGRLNAIAVGPDGHLYVNHGAGTDIGPVSIRRIRLDPA